MKRRPVIFVALVSLLLALGLTGCSRTIDDVINWKTKGRIEKLIKALTDPKVEIRMAATEALGDLKAESAVDRLAALYNDSEEAVVLTAVDALSAIGSRSTTTPLIAALKLNYPTARTSAAVALGRMKATGAVLQLGEALGDSEPSVQLAAAISLGQIGEETGSVALVEKLDEGSNDLRLTCIEALALTGGEPAVKGLILALADKNEDVAKAAVAALIQLGDISVDHALEALRNDHRSIRSGSIDVLHGLEAVPLTGNYAIWYQLARVSIDQQEGIDLAVVKTLAQMGDKGIDTLLEAVTHNVLAFREHAGLALELNGDSCLANVMAAANKNTNSNAKAWFNSRNLWKGAPSWRIDLWSSIASLNPDFNFDQTTAENLKKQGRAAFDVITAPDFKLTREYIPALINLLGDQTPSVEQLSKEKLSTAQYMSTLPLIAAIEDENELIAGHAAQILSEQKEKRALEPLMKVVAQKFKAGEQLTTSPFYATLQKMGAPEAEPLLLKIRPSKERAMHVFEHKYSGVRLIRAEIKDESLQDTQPITFQLGYSKGEDEGKLMITFSKDMAGDWRPSPPLPDQLPAQ